MKRASLFFSFFLLSIFSFAQKLEFSLHLSPSYNHPKLSTTKNVDLLRNLYSPSDLGSPRVDFVYPVKGKFGVNLGLNTNYLISKTFFLSSGVMVNSVNFSNNFDVKFERKAIYNDRALYGRDGVGRPISSFYGYGDSVNLHSRGDYFSSRSAYQNSIAYLTIPVIVNYNLSRLSVNAGLNFSTVIYSRIKYTEKTTTVWPNGNKEIVERVYKDKSGKEFSDFSLACTMGIGYKLSPSFTLQASYVRGITDIFTNDKEGKLNSFSIGISWMFKTL